MMTDVVTAVLSTLVEYNNYSLVDDTDKPEENEKSQDLYMEVLMLIVPSLMVLIALIGLTGNLVVLYIIFRNKEMQNITNYFIANLALTDVALLAICALPTAASITQLSLGVVLCKSINYMQYVTVQATCFTLTAMSIDRYNLIVHAVKSRTSRTTTKTFIINISIWIVSFVMHSPVAVFMTYDSEKGYCPLRIGTNGEGEKYYYLASVLCMYIIPLVIILLCYAKILMIVWRKTSAGTESAAAQERSIRQKRKTTRMVFIVVLLFGLCWLPMHSFMLWRQFAKPNYASYSVMKIKAITTIQAFAMCLCYANSCVNPFIYAFTTISFKKHFKKIFVCWKLEDDEVNDHKPGAASTAYNKIGKYAEYSTMNTNDTKV